jgi:hypothetical protein
MANSWNQSSQPYQTNQQPQSRLSMPQRLQITAGNERQNANRFGSSYPMRSGGQNKGNQPQNYQRPQEAYVEDEEPDKKNVTPFETEREQE